MSKDVMIDIVVNDKTLTQFTSPVVPLPGDFVHFMGENLKVSRRVFWPITGGGLSGVQLHCEMVE